MTQNRLRNKKRKKSRLLKEELHTEGENAKEQVFAAPEPQQAEELEDTESAESAGFTEEQEHEQTRPQPIKEPEYEASRTAENTEEQAALQGNIRSLSRKKHLLLKPQKNRCIHTQNPDTMRKFSRSLKTSPNQLKPTRNRKQTFSLSTMKQTGIQTPRLSL